MIEKFFFILITIRLQKHCKPSEAIRVFHLLSWNCPHTGVGDTKRAMVGEPRALPYITSGQVDQGDDTIFASELTHRQNIAKGTAHLREVFSSCRKVFSFHKDFGKASHKLIFNNFKNFSQSHTDQVSRTSVRDGYGYPNR